jgi:hypothetical protein
MMQHDSNHISNPALWEDVEEGDWDEDYSWEATTVTVAAAAAAEKVQSQMGTLADWEHTKHGDSVPHDEIPTFDLWRHPCDQILLESNAYL